MSDQRDVLDQLMDLIRQRKANPPPRSYTATLFEGGIQLIGGKITEEAAELVEAAGEAGDQGREHFIHECADLLYHLFVMLGHCGVTLDDVRAELANRFGVSGLDERESRGR